MPFRGGVGGRLRRLRGRHRCGSVPATELEPQAVELRACALRRLQAGAKFIQPFGQRGERQCRTAATDLQVIVAPRLAVPTKLVGFRSASQVELGPLVGYTVLD